jgi:menaquinone-9 beta-reductase
MGNISTSVIIVGAGPAGAGTSFFLSKDGIPHVVIEKDTFPRDKVCGDACSGKTALVLNRANVEWMDEIREKTVDFLPSWGITFYAPNGKPLDVPFNPNRGQDAKAPGFTTPRLVFDEFLFSKMPSPHCAIMQGAQLLTIDHSAAQVQVVIRHAGEEHTITAPVLVGADGDKSMVRKHFVNDGISSKAYAVGLRAYYSGITDMHDEQFIELHFLPEMLPGYLWIFPLPHGMANVGVGILSDVVKRKKINLREQMLQAIRSNPRLKPRFEHAELQGKIQGWGLPLAIGSQRLSGDRFLLTGDAASLVDPFSGEGIGNALYSGMLAAAAIKECMEQNNYSSAFIKKAYDDVVYKRLGDEFRISAALQRLCRYQWLFNLVVNKARKSRSLRDTISSMFTDLNLRDKLRSPSFYWDILVNK